MRKIKKNAGRGFMGLLVSVLVFVSMLVILLIATRGVAGGNDEEGIRATRVAVQRAAVLCYATEGFYPPTLTYIEENYLIKIDHSRFLVNYNVQGSNLMPNVQVFLR